MQKNIRQHNKNLMRGRSVVHKTKGGYFVHVYSFKARWFLLLKTVCTSYLIAAQLIVRG